MRQILLAAALSVALCAGAQAQVVSVQVTRTYTPVVVQPSYLPPVYNAQLGQYNMYPLIAPNYPSTLNIYPQVPVTYSYYAAPVYPYPVPAPGTYSSSYYSSNGVGPFKSKTRYSQLYYYP